MEKVRKYYVEDLKSISDISKITKIPKSTLYNWLKKWGVLRTRKEGFDLAYHKLGQHMKGKKRTFSKKWIDNMRNGANKRWNGQSKGYSLKPNGYYEITTGVNKGRGVHVVKMEGYIGRRLKQSEVVHHKNKIKTDNRKSNLQLMTRSEHARIHAEDNSTNRVRNNKGQFN